ncbi:MAG: phytoene desaturase family protein [Thermoprotei archaeon]
MYDAVVVGGGHNGLVAAAYLAKAGLRVAVFERRPFVGGAAVTEEIAKGIRASTGSYVLSLLRPKIIEDLRLRDFGLKVVTKDPAMYLPLGKGRGVTVWLDAKKTAKEFERFSKRDAESYLKFVEFLDTFSLIADSIMLSPPPSVEEVLSTLKGLGLPREKVAEIERFLVMDGYTLLNEWFESEEVRAALAEDAVVGTAQPITAPGTAYVFLHHNVGEVNRVKGAWGYVLGGMGAVSEAIRKAAEGFGAEVYTNSEVEEIVVKGGEVKGVKLRNGKFVESRVVLSNADVKTTFLKLVKDGLEEDFLRRVKALKTAGVSFKINGYSDRLPDYGQGQWFVPQHVSSQLVIPSLDYLVKAYGDFLTFGYSKEPWLSLNIPTTVDPTLAPQGVHVVNVFGQYASYNSDPEKVLEAVKSVLREYFDFTAVEVLTPKGIEAKFGMSGGNIFHVDMTIDALLDMRPLPEVSNYRTPVKGLYLCSSSAHPGGGVTGAPGHNAAMAVLEDLSRRRSG